MNFLSLFAGIGGFDLGLEKEGHTCVGQIELEPFCNRVLARRFPHVTRWPDVREWEGRTSFGLQLASLTRDQSSYYSPYYGCGEKTQVGYLDLLVGGFPCQDLSVAGKRKGLSGERSGLFWEIVRIAKETQPPWGLFENVPGLLSSHHGRDMWTVLTGLRECWPVVGYRIFDSRYFGVAQRRRRVFFVCGPTEQGVSQILFEPEGRGGYSPAGGETGEGVAATLRSRTQKPGVNMAERGGEDDNNLSVNSDCGASHWRENDVSLSSSDDNGTNHIVAAPLTASYGKQIDSSDRNGGPPNLIHGVRRLTPLECERLQGFPDGWTCLCQPLDAYQEDPDAAHLQCKCPDSPRYRALGNAVTVNVIQWFGRRLEAA